MTPLDQPLIIQYPSADGYWMLHPPADPWDDGYFAVLRMDLSAPGLRAGTSVQLSWPEDGGDIDLVAFLQQLADDWAGWPGTRSWHTLDDELEISARHDGRGHVTLTCALRQPGRWRAEVPVELEAGEQLSHLVADVRAHFASVRRPSR